MWGEISWGRYFEITGSAAGLYYLTVLCLYYKQEVTHLFFRGHGQLEPIKPVLPQEPITALIKKPSAEKQDSLDSLRIFLGGVDELKALILQSKIERAGKEQLLISLKKVVQKHFSDLSQSYHGFVSHMIALQMDQHFGIRLGADELKDLWGEVD